MSALIALSLLASSVSADICPSTKPGQCEQIETVCGSKFWVIGSLTLSASGTDWRPRPINDGTYDAGTCVVRVENGTVKTVN